MIDKTCNNKPRQDSKVETDAGSVRPRQ